MKRGSVTGVEKIGGMERRRTGCSKSVASWELRKKKE